MGEAADQANLLTKEQLRLREEAEDLKNYRIKDMHSSISNMILMVSAEKNPSVKNDRQCSEFKLKEGELWTQFAGMHLDDRAKMKGTIMCT